MGKALNRAASEKDTIPCGRGSPRQPALPQVTCHTCAQVTVQAGGAPAGWASGHLQACCSAGERLPFLFLFLLKGAEVEGEAFRACWVNMSLVARAAVACQSSASEQLALWGFAIHTTGEGKPVSRDWGQEQVNPGSASSKTGPMCKVSLCHSSVFHWRLSISRIYKTLSASPYVLASCAGCGGAPLCLADCEAPLAWPGAAAPPVSALLLLGPSY